MLEVGGHEPEGCSQMVNETPQGSHVSRREKSGLQARSFRVTYFEDSVRDKSQWRERGFRDQQGIRRKREKRKPEKEGSG